MRKFTSDAHGQSNHMDIQRRRKNIHSGYLAEYPVLVKSVRQISGRITIWFSTRGRYRIFPEGGGRDINWSQILRPYRVKMQKKTVSRRKGDVPCPPLTLDPTKNNLLGHLHLLTGILHSSSSPVHLIRIPDRAQIFFQFYVQGCIFFTLPPAPAKIGVIGWLGKNMMIY